MPVSGTSYCSACTCGEMVKASLRMRCRSLRCASTLRMRVVGVAISYCISQRRRNCIVGLVGSRLRAADEGNKCAKFGPVVKVPRNPRWPWQLLDRGNQAEISMGILRVRHLTTYSYARPVRFGEHRLLFRPRDSHEQRLLGAELKVSPQPSDVSWVHDVFGNCITNLSFDTPAEELRFETEIVLDHSSQLVPRFRTEERAKLWPFEYDADILPDLAPYLRVHNPSAELEAWARKFTRAGLETETGRLLMTMTMGVRESLAYSRRTDPGTQSPQFTLQARKGTCRDFAWLMIEA
ncbi:MAG: hypothetical protein EOP18_10985, partial [Rhizobiaceae bacterium]